MRRIKVEDSPILRELKKAKKKVVGPKWLEGEPRPRHFTLAEDISSYQEVLKIKESTKHLRSHDGLLAMRMSGERRWDKAMYVHHVVNGNEIEVRYIPRKRTRMKAGTPLILVGTMYLEN